ncbi:hypothetical protein [Micromonospora sp. C81]|uniref:hypothetical protein n=1 Tax=Micromonospora sp. C81 TaxID=2824881 RepID=UPI001FFDA404|nr:hypothetical protein [Micromonospora sp. C81]
MAGLRPRLAVPVLAWPVLAVPVLAWSVLARRVLAVPVLARPVLAWPVLSIPVLAVGVRSGLLAGAPIRVRLGAGCLLTRLLPLRLGVGPTPVVVAAGLLGHLRLGSSPSSTVGRLCRLDALVRAVAPLRASNVVGRPVRVSIRAVPLVSVRGRPRVGGVGEAVVGSAAVVVTGGSFAVPVAGVPFVTGGRSLLRAASTR